MRLGDGQFRYQASDDDDDLSPGTVCKYIGGGFCGLGFLAAVLSLILGIGSVEVTEVALNYSILKQNAEPKSYTSGRYFIGPFNYFVRFPAVVRTIQFSDPHQAVDLSNMEQGDGLLRSRTSDGLDVSIEISFQYQLNSSKLYTLYTTLDEAPHFHNAFVRVAMHRLTELATRYSATEFFTQRTQIGKTMEAELRKEFEGQLFATIFSFQLRSVQLPSAFEDAIQETEVTKQDYQVALVEQNATRVQLETELMKAKRRVLVAGQRADATANSTMLTNSADIEQYTITQHKAADSFAEVLHALGGDKKEVLQYMEARVIRDHASDKVTLGLGSR